MRLAQADRLTKATGLDLVEAGWRPTFGNYLNRVTKPRILQAVREGAGEQAAQLIDHLKKGDMAKEAERLLAESRADAVAIFLADMPLIRQDSLETLLAHASANTIVLPSHQGKRGHPVLFGRDFWPQLVMLAGDAGAKVVLQHNAEALHIIELDDPGVLPRRQVRRAGDPAGE